MSTKKDMLERIADAIDGGGDFGQGTVNEVGYLERIAKYIEENGFSGGGSGGGSSSGGALIVHTDESGIMDKTWQEIHDALAMMPVMLVADDGGNNISSYPIQQAYFYEDKYVVGYWDENTLTQIYADSPNDYPSFYGAS